MNVLPSPAALVEPDLAAEQPGDLAADGEAEARAAVLAARAAVGLLEGLEDDLLLVAGDADARVGDRERDDRLRAGSSELVVGAPALADRLERGADTRPRSVNLKALESRFLRTCCSRFGVRDDPLGADVGSISIANSSFFASATWRKVRST